MANTERRLCTIPQTQVALGVGRSTVYLLMDSGRLESVKIGARRLVVSDSIDRYVDALRAPRTSSMETS